MKKRYSYINAISTALAIAGFLFIETNARAQVQSNASETDSEAPRLSTNTPPAGFASRWDYVKSFTNETDILNAARAGLLNGDESMLAMSRLGNTTSVDTYGKVVDQNGQPIAGVKVRGRVELGIGDYEDHNTETDGHGQFDFLGLHGQGLMLRFQKHGYDFGKGLQPERPSNYLPDTNNPLVFTMWKLRGAEPMVHAEIQAGLACDGTPRSFNLLTGQRLSSGGDLVASLIRNPVDIDRRKHFNWTLTLQVTNGGLVEIQDGFADEAPEKGYQQTITISMPADTNNWTPFILRSYYFKSRNGLNYGKMTINLMANYEPPPTHFEIDAYVNPAGSRNLEFDYKKQIH